MNKIIKIPSDMSNIFRAENLIEAVSEELKLGDELIGNISVSVVEAVSNAIQHGNKNDITKIVLLGYNISDNLLSFTVSDEGKGFDVENIPDPTLPENIENIKGRGIFLIRNLADSVSFDRNGSTIHIHFSI
jgi:serine/threonine-protein kinase RsbW